MNGHTSGPWHERTRTILQHDCDGQREECIEIGAVETDQTVAYVPFAVEHPASHWPIAEADARLIAKAPAMYQALTRLSIWAEHMGGWEAPVWTTVQELLDEIDKP